MSFSNFYSGKKVLVTGHTGFKGSWLTLWLNALGAHVIGFSLEPPTDPSNFALSHVKEKTEHFIADIRDLHSIQEVIQTTKPDIIFHLAAQPIVLHSYQNPIETLTTNVMGTAHLLEAIRQSESVQAAVLITSDKCYENKEWVFGYRENDRLGGQDPYSASKAMAELVSSSYRSSFFSEQSAPQIATARAGNVIGGGDFSDFRLVPDTMLALMANKPVLVRNPESVRPWLHVLDPLSGYLWLGVKLATSKKTFAESWNFGPKEPCGIAALSLVKKAIEHWGSGSYQIEEKPKKKKETHLLRLNWDKAAHQLDWHPVYSWKEAIEETTKWYQAYHLQKKMDQVCLEQIQRYVEMGKKQKLAWTSDEIHSAPH